MVMERDAYENLMNELNSPELPHDRRTEILQTLRQDYSAVWDDHEKHTKSIQDLQNEREQLLLTNSKLFRSSSYFNKDEDLMKDQEQKTFSETIKLSDIEKKVGR